MKQKTQQEDLIVRYLLGDLTEEEQIQIEERFFIDDDYFEQVCSVEDALVDDYVQEALTESECRKVESRLRSSPRQAHEIQFTRELIGYLSEPSSKELTEQNALPVECPSKWQTLFMWLRIKTNGRRFSFAVTLLLIAVGIFLVIWNLALQRKLEQIQTRQAELEESDQELRKRIDQQVDGQEATRKELEGERKRRELLEDELAALREFRPFISANEIATLDLKPESFSRGDGELKVVTIHRGVTRFQIRIHLDQDNYEIYSAVIKTFEGREIWSKDHIRPEQGKLAGIVLALPASILVNHDYIVTLRGQTEAENTVEIGDYPFRIRR